MARIRAIKPEFWSSPGHPADPWARLLYIAMWNWADDAGVGTANMKELAGFAFPNDDHIETGAMRRLCADIAAHYGATFYMVGGRPYYAIPTWKDHQKFDNRRGGKYPGPDEAESVLDLGEPEKPARCADGAPEVRPHVGAKTAPEHRNRGTGEQGNLVPLTYSGTDRANEKSVAIMNRINQSGVSPAASEVARGYAGWADNGIDTMTQIEIAKEVDPLLADGIDPRQIAAGIKAWHSSDSWSPTQLRRFVAKAARPATQPIKATLKSVDTMTAAEQIIAAMKEETA